MSKHICNGKEYCDCAGEAMKRGANRDWVDGLEDQCQFRTACSHSYGGQSVDRIVRCNFCGEPKPEEVDAVTKDIIARMSYAQFGSPDQSKAIEDHMKEFFTRFPSYKPKFTHLEWYHIFLDFLDHKPKPVEIGNGDSLEHQVFEALVNIIEIGKRDMTNPKYDSYFQEAKEVIKKARAIDAPGPHIEITPEPCPSHKDPFPGYIEWHNWADGLIRKGIRQTLCYNCGRWFFPQEM
jgi:hypothetical protein